MEVETLNSSIQMLKNQIEMNHLIIFILIIITGILCIIALFYILKIRKNQQEELNYLKDEIENLLTEGFVAGTEKNITENAKKFSEMEKSMTLNVKNNLLQGITQLNRELSGNNEKLLVRFTDFGTKLGSAMNENNQRMSENINKFKDELKKEISNDFETLNRKIENKLDMMNTKVEERLSKGFEETTKTFGNVLERLGKIDEAQKKIEDLSSNVVSLQDVLTDKKSRGIFGEVQMYQILSSVFGEKNDRIYRKQYKLSNGMIVDAVIFAPEPMGNIAVDSKFPLENYRRMYDSELTLSERENAKKEFSINLKKHIDDISSKYIVHGETSDQAILFLPAEAVFAEINAYHTEIIEYAYRKNVRIASPTTLMSVLTTLQVIMMNIERDKYAHIIQEELIKLNKEFDRYQERWTTLEKDIEKVTRDVKSITTTSNKITKRFNEISSVEFTEKVTVKNGEIQ
ncbi:DNA recombination protein RmuC [Leptotrichia sp. OH3620_COT-345]|uniref:DNA recombination protein RmuC n=1 Tax=Leptotrichia sp. OH3620_COT-345 TaxID=2491048 RepID=UPI001F395BA3|nr:DNA recombination protein RmuC [Leptotrichia sp. OH3620_COT-345]